MEKVVFSTWGDGYWSTAEKAVEIVDIVIGYCDEEKDFGELRVVFNTDIWNVEQDGLIYTDAGFLDDLQEFLNQHSLAGGDVSYSEQGMQGNNYVSLDVGKVFIETWEAKFGELTV
jgi:hypothetical protein